MLASLRLFAREVMPAFGRMLVGTGDRRARARRAALAVSHGAPDAARRGELRSRSSSRAGAAAAAARTPPDAAARRVLARVARARSPLGAVRARAVPAPCRSGLRPRGFLVAGVIEHEAARAALAERWGFALGLGVALARATTRPGDASRSAGDRARVALRDPMPLRSARRVVRGEHAPRAHAARPAPRAGRPDYASRAPSAAGRWSTRSTRRRAAAPGLRPGAPVAASFARGRDAARVRYVCRPDVLAFLGTERVDD